MDNDDLRELIELRMGSLREMFSREMFHMTKAMERVADESAPVLTVQSLLKRVDRLERDSQDNLNKLDQLTYKIRIMWYVWGIILAGGIAVFTEYIKAWLGL